MFEKALFEVGDVENFLTGPRFQLALRTAPSSKPQLLTKQVEDEGFVLAGLPRV